ncbi:MAG: YesL family protein [Bifidobacteriaceae bacterium]|nr:YesL family protein [Bifidobacteriaceae bacterium]
MHFNLNNPVWGFMRTLAAFTALNLVFLVTMVPIVTIGPALGALYSTLFAYIDHDDISLTREYLKRFTHEFKQGILSWLVYLIIGAALLFGAVFWLQVSSNVTYVIYPILIIAAVVYLLSLEYMYPLQARFANSSRRLWALSLMVPWKVLGMSCALIAIDIAALSLGHFSAIIRVLMVVFGLAWVAYAKSLVFTRAFAKISHPEGNKDEGPLNPQASLV